MNIFHAEKRDGSSRGFAQKDLGKNISRQSLLSQLSEFDESFCDRRLFHLALSGTTLFILLTTILFLWAKSAYGNA